MEASAVHGFCATEGDPVRSGRQNGRQNGSQSTTQNGRGTQGGFVSEPCLSGLPRSRGLPLAARPTPLPCRPPKGTVETRVLHGTSAPEEVAVRIATQNATGTASRTATHNERAI